MDMQTLRLDPPPALSAADDTDRCAYNGAFWDMGFKWQWDTDTYRELCRMPEEARIRAYVERHQRHLLQAYNLDFLIDLIHENKMRRHAALAAAKAAGEPPDLSCNALRAAQ